MCRGPEPPSSAELPPLSPPGRGPGRYLLPDERQHSRLLGLAEADAVQGTLAPGDGGRGLIHGAQPGTALQGITGRDAAGICFSPCFSCLGCYPPFYQLLNLPACTHGQLRALCPRHPAQPTGGFWGPFCRELGHRTCTGCPGAQHPMGRQSRDLFQEKSSTL